ncbi:helix-turn-helix domain-containing protein [Rhodohalobacter barkolensis]|uniref:Helix-turn-helix domain-containing protein n=1 Tax=Rhodohalobacter barkolensis TaxID=2053187 RepID=A0A2N0VM59_9BACT|nr:helix-turn-helix domain-containing protein [Rhodohalobacter barkolensis]PKD45283.1 hypothetical protein CWD77_07525 [Rhodohalobacter barkolensis]
MQAYIPDEATLEKVIAKVTRRVVIEILPDVIRKATRKEWLTTDDVMEILDCSRRHVQYLRDSKQLTFSQNGRTIRYHFDDLESFMNSHKVESERA